MAEEFKVDNQKIAKAISLLTAVYNVPNEQTYLRARQLIEDAAEIKSDIQAIRADTVEKVPLEFFESKTKWLNDWIVGARLGELVLVGGWPFSGKTHLMVWLDAQYPGAKTAHFYVEDLPQDMLRYYESSHGTDLKDVWLIEMKDSPFTIAAVNRVYQDQKRAGVAPDIIVLDHLDEMHSSVNVAGNDWLDAVNVVKEVKAFARRENVLVIAASLAYPKTSDRVGMGRFYRAPVAKSHVPDVVLMIDKIEHGDYYVTREKAKGRNVPWDSSKKILRPNWSTMQVEDVTFGG